LGHAGHRPRAAPPIDARYDDFQCFHAPAQASKKPEALGASGSSLRFLAGGRDGRPVAHQKKS
jgi:hypothetical protein